MRDLFSHRQRTLSFVSSNEFPFVPSREEGGWDRRREDGRGGEGKKGKAREEKKKREEHTDAFGQVTQ